MNENVALYIKRSGSEFIVSDQYGAMVHDARGYDLVGDFFTELFKTLDLPAESFSLSLLYLFEEGNPDSGQDPTFYFRVNTEPGSLELVLEQADRLPSGVAYLANYSAEILNEETVRDLILAVTTVMMFGCPAAVFQLDFDDSILSLNEPIAESPYQMEEYD